MTTLSAPSSQVPIIERVKGILLRPKAEWPIIAAEPTSVGSIYSTYVVYVAAIPVVCTLIGSLIFGYGYAGLAVRPSFFGALWTAAVQYALQLGGVYVFAMIIDALAPRFGGISNRVSAFKLAAYSTTASWVAGAFTLVPALSFLSILGLYSLYLLYTGAPVLTRVAREKAVVFTAAIVGVGIVLGIVAALLLVALTPELGPRQSAKLQPGSGMSSLDDATKRLEYITKQMEAARGQDPKGDSAPGDLASITPHDLKALLPEEVSGGYRREQVSTSSGGAGGFTLVNAQAEYTKSDGGINLSLSDIGPLGAFASLGSILGAHSTEETETSYAKLGDVDGRMTAESYDRTTASGTYSVLVGNRILVEAKGHGATMAELKDAVRSVDLARLQSLLENRP
jgi:hypothetical protein